MNTLEKLNSDPRVTVRKAGPPDPSGNCIVYWMQRAQRGTDNPALDMAVNLGNELGKSVVVFFAPVPYYLHATQRPYSFLADGVPGIARDVANRRIGFVLRAYPEHSLLKFCAEVRPATVIGDENPLREPEKWRCRVAEQVRMPFWTVDADVIVPSRLLGREHYAARTIRPKLNELLSQFLVPLKNPLAHTPWTAPPGLRSIPLEHDFTSDWILDRSAPPVKTAGWQQAGPANSA